MGKINKEVAKTIKTVCDWMNRTAPFDKTYFGYVKSVVSSGNYEVIIANVSHVIPFNGTLTIGQKVKVISPMNVDEKMYIVIDDTNVGDINTPTITGVTSVNGETGAVVLNDVKYVSQTLTSDQQSQARSNIGAGTSSFSGSYTDLTNQPTIPTQTSQLTNDSNFITTTQAPVQSVNSKTGTVVLSKSDIGLSNVDNVQQYSASNPPPYPVTSVDSSTGDVVLSDVKYISQSLTFAQQQQARTNIGAGTSSFSGSYNDLTNQPSIPTKTSELTNDSNYITSAQAPVQSVNGYTGTVTLSKSDVGLSNVDNVQQYSATNPPPYPVTSVNSLTGAVSLTTDNVPATTTNRYVPSVPTTNPETSYLNGNGTFSSIAVGGASSVANIFLSNTASTVSGYKTLNYVADTAVTEMSVTVTNSADVLSATYLYSAPLGVTVIDSGIWKSTFYMKCSTASTGVNRLKLIAFVRHTDGTETDLFTKYTSSVNLAVYDSYYTETNHPQLSVLATDTLGFRVYGNTTRNASTTIYYQLGGTNASFINSPLALKHSQLRDLNGDSNYQHITSTQVTQIGTNTTNIANLQSSKLDATGDGSNVTSAFTASSTLTNITSGSKLSVFFGVIYTAISNLISHIANVSNPHSVTKSQVGLGNVDNVQQYSSTNPPPYPVTSVNSKTGAVSLSLDDMSDVTLTSSASGQILSYNGTNWINSDPASYSQLQSNWSETNTSSVQYIQNKPTALSAFTNDTNYVNTTQLATKNNIQVTSTQPTNQSTNDLWFEIKS